tara:strand:- start:15995 stop:16402 length:408 start_codon:yes stop_codon:yes gene_type:complete
VGVVVSDLHTRISALEAELKHLREMQVADLKAAYIANDSRILDLSLRFDISPGRIARFAKEFGWPKRKQYQTPEQRAKRSATFKEKGLKPTKRYIRPRIRPLPGTDEHRLFRKLAYRCGLGAAAAHAELRRGAHG